MRVWGLCNCLVLAFSSIGSRSRARHRIRLLYFYLPWPSVTGTVFKCSEEERGRLRFPKRGMEDEVGQESRGAEKFRSTEHLLPGELGQPERGCYTCRRNLAAVPQTRLCGSEVAWERSRRGDRAWSCFPERERRCTRPSGLLSRCPLPFLCARGTREEGPRRLRARPACTERPAEGPCRSPSAFSLFPPSHPCTAC